MKQSRGLIVLFIFCIAMLVVMGVLFFQKSKNGWKSDESQEHLFSFDFESDTDVTSMESFFSDENTLPEYNTAKDSGREYTFMTITAKEAKEKMDNMDKSNLSYTILDVRTPEEYEDEHIENALLIPDYDLIDKIVDTVPDKKTVLFVYCRSGRRSAAAAENLSALGYESIYDFGGIIDWPYDTVTQ